MSNAVACQLALTLYRNLFGVFTILSAVPWNIQGTLVSSKVFQKCWLTGHLAHCHPTVILHLLHTAQPPPSAQDDVLLSARHPSSTWRELGCCMNLAPSHRHSLSLSHNFISFPAVRQHMACNLGQSHMFIASLSNLPQPCTSLCSCQTHQRCWLINPPSANLELING